MDLKDFVRDVLTSIMAGINEAESAAKEHGAIINPGGSANEVRSEGGRHIVTPKTINKTQLVEFDVALTVESVGTRMQAAV